MLKFRLIMILILVSLGNAVYPDEHKKLSFKVLPEARKIHPLEQ